MAEQLIKPTFFERAVSLVSPRLAAERMIFRASYSGGIPTRLNRGWSQSTSNTQTVIPNRQQQTAGRDRARTLDQNNVLASGILDRACENVIGTGIQVEPATDSPDFNARASEVWEDWKTARAGDGGTRCDVRGLRTFDEMQSLMFRCLLRDGDVGAVLVNAFGQPMIQGVMGDYIESPPGKACSPMSVDGIVTGLNTRPTSYYVKGINEKMVPTYYPVAARDFIFLAKTDSTDQIRGITRFNQGADLFDMIMGYLDASVVSARAAAFFSLLITRENAASVFRGLPTGSNSSSEPQKKITIESGTAQYLNPGEKVEQVKPEQPIQGFGDAIATFCRFTGLKFGLPLEEVLLDYSQANYTVSRAIKMKIQRIADTYQRDFANAFVSRIYRYVISMKINAGEFRGVAIPANYWNHEWIPQPLPLVDPGKEIQAAKDAIDLGVEARTFIARGMGYRFNVLCKQNNQDRELMKANNLPINDQPQGQTAVQAGNAQAAKDAATALAESQP